MLNFDFAQAGRQANDQRQRAGSSAGAPLERIRAIVQKNQIVAMQLPFQTPRAQNVRNFVHARLLTQSNQKMFYWRRETQNMWTNLALDTQPGAPKLTAPPVEAATAIMQVLPQCPDVSEVNLFDENNVAITLDDVKVMDFIDLPVGGSQAPDADALPALPTANLDTILEKVNVVMGKVEDMAIVTKRDAVQLQTNVELKLSYIIDKLDGRAREVDRAAAFPTPNPGEPTSSRDEMQLDQDDEADEEATPRRPSRASKAQGRKKQKA